MIFIRFAIMEDVVSKSVCWIWWYVVVAYAIRVKWTIVDFEEAVVIMGVVPVHCS